MKRLRWLASGLLALALVLALLLAWLFGSGGGRDFALRRLQAALPAMQLTFGPRTGTLAGPLRVEWIEARLADGRRLRIEDVLLQWRLPPLLRRQLTIERAQARAVRITPAAPVEPQPWQPPERLPWPDIDSPVAVDVRALHIDALAYAELAPIAVQARAQLSRAGRLALDALRITGEFGTIDGRGRLPLDGQPAGELALDLTPGEPSLPRWRLEFAPRGSAQGLSLQGGASRVQLELEGDVAWRLSAALRPADLAAWWPQAEAIEAFELDAAGEGLTAQVQGRYGEDWRVLPSMLAWQNEPAGLRLQPLRLVPTAGGELRVTGSLPVAPEHAVDLRVVAEAVQLARGDAPPVRLDGSGTISGPRAALALDYQGAVQRADERLPLILRAAVEDQRIRLERLQLGAAPAWLDASGHIDRGEPLRIELQGRLQNFDPSWWQPGLPGRLNAELELDAQRNVDRWQARLRLARLAGVLRGNRVGGRVDLDWQPAAAAVDADLRIGDGRLRVEGEASADEIELEARIEQLQLASVWPGAKGRWHGQLRIDGARTAPWLALDLRGNDVAVGATAVAALRAKGRFPLGDGQGQLQVDASNARIGAVPMHQANLHLDGAAAGYRARLQVRADVADLDVRAEGAHAEAERWLRLTSLTLQEARTGAWRLAEPARLDYRERPRLERACLYQDTARLCAALVPEGDAMRLQATLRDLPLAVLMLAQQDAREWRIDGRTDADLSAEWGDDGLRAVRGEARSDGGALQRTTLGERELLRWETARLTLERVGAAWQADLAGALVPQGRITGQLTLPVDGDAPLQGELNIDVPRFAALELVSTELDNASARLQGRLSFAGTRNVPQYGGEVVLDDLSAELGRLGVRLADSRLRVAGSGERLAVDGVLSSGAGALRIEGELAPLADDQRGSLRIVGNDVRIADTPSLQINASPDLNLRWRRRGLRLTGQVRIDEARAELESLTGGGARTSPDVVVLDPREPAAQSAEALAIDAQLKVVLGEDVQLVGFGFDGELSGEINVRERPGRIATASGSLAASGTYTAYGQQLEIERGRLLYAAAPLDNPALDIRASRTIDDRSVGVQVRGRARSPELTLWSEPPMEQTEALSYLLFGRGLGAASAEEGALLGQAAAAFGGNLLAGQVGKRLGFDTAGVSQSAALGGAAFTFGKYLSPSLYLSYGVSLFDGGQLLSLRYTLGRGFEVELASGRENRVGLRYRREAD